MRPEHVPDRFLAGWSFRDTASLVALALAGSWTAATIVRESPRTVHAVPAQLRGTVSPQVSVGVADTADLSLLSSMFGAEGGVTDAFAMTPAAAPAAADNWVPPVLVGVALLPDRRLAILRLATGQTRVFAEGEQWDGFRVASIRAGSVHVERRDSARVLELGWRE